MTEQPKNSKKKLKDTDLRHAKPPPLPAYVENSNDMKGDKKGDDEKNTSTEMEEMMKSIKKSEDEIHHYLNIIYEHTGWSPATLSSFLDDSNNFSKEDWEIIQKQKDELLAQFNTPKEMSDRIDYTKRKPIVKKKKLKSPGQRRGWLPMK